MVEGLLPRPRGLLATTDRLGLRRYFHTDHLGSPRAITDDAGAMVGRHDYYPFGTEVPRFGQTDEPMAKFTGHPRDPHGLMDDHGARAYAFPLSRYVSADPARDGWNLYAYVRNNPLKYLDPDGRTRANALAAQYVVEKFGARNLTSAGVGFAPVAGEIHDAIQVLTGRDLITGERLSAGERLLTLGAAALPFVGGKAAREAVEGVGEAIEGAVRAAPEEIGDLLRSANQADRGGLTRAGRSLTKHGQGAREGNRLFPEVRGNPDAINAQARSIVEEILADPKTTVLESRRGRFGETIEYIAPDGRGVVYDAKGNFLFFRE